jgi:hypothetical protein
MQWGREILEWLSSTEGSRVFATVVVPALAIIVAGVIGGLIGRGSTKRVIAQYNRDALTAAVQSLVLAGRKAAGWNSIGTVERVQVDHLIGEAETRIRLLAVPGAALAANWAAHQLDDMKRNSAGFSFQAQQTLGEYRDRLISWSEKPRTAKKLFGADLERWKYDADPAEQALVAEQAQWETAHSLERETAAVSTASSSSAAAPESEAPSTDWPKKPTSADVDRSLVPATSYAPGENSSAPRLDTASGEVPTQAWVRDDEPASPASPHHDDAPAPRRAHDVRELIDPRDPREP